MTSQSGQRIESWKTAAWGLSAAVALGGLTAAWLVFAPGENRATSVEVGRLPVGLQPDDLNVLLITLDTTRADRIGAYGFSGIQTPALDRIASEGVTFEHAVAPSAVTLPAHASIFTGKYPPHHGVRDNEGFFLDADETSLAERLKDHGFQTGGFIGAFVLDRRWGIAQGFDTYFDEFDEEDVRSRGPFDVERPANEVADKALAWLETVAGQRFFGCGSISTIRTCRTRRPSLLNRNMTVDRTSARSPSWTRRSGGCSPFSRRGVCSGRRSLS